MAIVHNIAKRKLRGGDIALGFGLHHLRSSAAPMLAAAAKHDYLMMDMEHGAFSVQEATQICIASLAAGIPPIVRVCAGALDEGTRLLDNGALGIVVPHVDTKAQAQRVADAFHYPPMGHRSWGGPPPVFGYMPPHVSEAQKAINDDENARRYIAMGSRYLSSGTDHSFIVSGSIERAKFYRDAAAEVRGTLSP